MEWLDFAGKIGLSEELQQKLRTEKMTETEYEKLSEVYKTSHEAFFDLVLGLREPPVRFLELYCKMACETFEKYKVCGIPEQIFWDTFQDIRFWCENYYEEYGVPGLGEYEWFWRHIDMKILRLGRLQYEQMVTKRHAGSGGGRIEKGTPVINIHIPQGEPLYWQRCEESLVMAYERYGRDLPYVCHSWLLDPALVKVLKEGSNILEFQKHFRILEVDYKERETEWRVFGRVSRIVKDYPENTSLQRRVKEYLQQGKVLGNGVGELTYHIPTHQPGVY